MRTLEEVKAYAIEKHKDQLYGNQPYIYHLDMVSAVLTKHGFTAENWRQLHICAYLHDVIEDTDMTEEALGMDFDPLTAQIVNAVSGEGSNRKEKGQSIYNKCAKIWAGRVIKLADRIANVEACKNDPKTRNPASLEKYTKEYEDFRKHLYRSDDGLDVMWGTLDGLVK